MKGGNTEHPFTGEVSVRVIAESLIEDTGLSAGPMDAIPADATVTNFRASGKPLEELKRLIEGVKGVSVIVDEKEVIRFARDKEPQPDSIRLIKSPKTGLIEVPEINEDDTVTLTMLFEPKASVGGEIVVEDSEYIEPIPYTIVGVNHQASNWTDSFKTIIDCIDPSSEENADA